jgi:hypothetical protein
MNSTYIKTNKTTPTTEQNITSSMIVTENYCSNDQQKTNIIYKYIEKYRISLFDNEIPNKLYEELYSTLLYKEDGSNAIKDILMQQPTILTKLLCNNIYDGTIKNIITESTINNIDAFLSCIYKQDKIYLISQSLIEKLFIYACKHPDKIFSSAIINLYQSQAYFFEPSYIKTIHDLFLNKEITTAINTGVSIEDKINSHNLFKARYHVNSKNNIFKSIDYLDVDTLSLKSKTEDIFSSTTNFIKNLKSVAIYLNSEYYPADKKKFHTFGDENACLNMLNQLISLGIKQVTIYVSPPNNSTIDERKKSYTMYKQYQYQKTKKYIVRKLSFLLNGIDSQLKLPQTIIKDGCTVNIRFIDEISSNNDTIQEKTRNFIESTIGIKYLSKHEELRATTVKENLVFVFYQNNFKNNNQNLSNVITIYPFSWRMHLENIIFAKTDTKPQCKIECKNPSYSILREQQATLPIKYTGKNAYKNWLFDLLATAKSKYAAETLSTIITLIAEKIKNKKIHHGTIYGLHHPYIKQNAKTILSTWINASTELSIQRQQAIVLSVISNTLIVNKQQFNNENTIIIDLSKCEDENNYFNQINSCLSDNKVIVLFFPSLPKTVFHYLIDSTTMPILVEGANITSYALQTGKSYLSVLPTGATAIPTKMGDPLIAFLQKVLSYKLAYSKDFLDHFKVLFNHVTNYNYQQAIDYIYKLKPFYDLENNEMLIDFFCKQNSDKSTETKEITLMFLLKKGQGGMLSDNTRKYLLQALDPSFNSISSYIKNSLDKNSKERFHSQLMQHHVNLAINDKLVIALNKFISEFKNRQEAEI